LLGSYLGQFTNEIDRKKGNFIKDIIAFAAKTYSYITDTDFSHALCKGIAFNHITKLSINFETLKNIIFEDTGRKIEVEQLQFIRNKENWSVKTQTGIKTLGYTFDKRFVLDNRYETLPYGY
jgi:hypothetical protein